MAEVALAALATGPSQGSCAKVLPVRGLLLAERLDTRPLERGVTLATAPLTLPIEERGVAVVFRYGVIVLFGCCGAAETRFLARLDAGEPTLSSLIDAFLARLAAISSAI
ncbi:MAG TPA: hypothetical protein VMU69_18100 [Bradyrhizobium sp.]|nr:hypothetical protein [Bradyrhizobium sp.]